MEPYINILILGMIQEFAAKHELHAISPNLPFAPLQRRNASQFTS